MRLHEKQLLRQTRAKKQWLLYFMQQGRFFGKILHKPPDLLPLTPEIQKGKVAAPGVLYRSQTPPQSPANAFPVTITPDLQIAVNQSDLEGWCVQSANVTALHCGWYQPERTRENFLEETR